MTPQSITPSSSRSRGFTIVELLTVLSIIAVLSAFVIPVVGTLGKSNTLNTTGNKIMGLLNYARQNSMTKAAMTGVLLCKDGSNQQLFTLFELVAPTDGSIPQTSDWYQISNWEALPEGVIVDPTQVSMHPHSLAVSPPFPTISRSGETIEAYTYALFLPDGRLLHEQTVSLRLTSGTFAADSSLIYTSEQVNGAPANFYDITILSATGRAKVDRP